MTSEKKVKQYCHRTNCEVVYTGFQFDLYPVCKICKEEVSNTLAKQIVDNDCREDEDTLTLWNMYNAQYFGDDQS